MEVFMPNYMTQTMSSPKTELITYYRKQKNQHPSHDESGAFTQAAQFNYATFNRIEENQVVVGPYRSGQGVPTGGKTWEI